MLYICEGLDKCGKSTFIQNALGINDYSFEAFDGIHTILGHRTMLDELFEKRDAFEDKNISIHLDSRDEDPYNTMIKILIISDICTVYLDRSFISDIVYGRVFRDGSKLSITQEQELINRLSEKEHCILYFKRKLDQLYFNSLDKNDDFEKCKESIFKLDKEYRRVMRKYYAQGLNIWEITMGAKKV